MKPNALFAACAAALVLAACETDVTEPQCNTIQPSIVETRGDTIVTAAGLRYIETAAGTGAAAVSCGEEEVEVSYELRLATDTTLIERGQFSFTPGFGQVIAGFEQGVVGTRVGGERRLIVPPSLGYGSQARRDSSGRVIIPANSTLIFDVELLAAGE